MNVATPSTEIEKVSLEAHVELCAARYRGLEDKLNKLEEKVDEHISVVDRRMGTVETALNDLSKAIYKQRDYANTRLIGWGVGVIVALTSALAFVVYHMIAG